jgi:cytochrome c553
VPGLLGLPRDYLNAQLGAWRTGQRRALAPDCMGEIARRLAPEELSAVTAWLASEPVPTHAKTAPVTAAAKRKGRKAQPPPVPESPALHCGAAPAPVAEAGR